MAVMPDNFRAGRRSFWATRRHHQHFLPGTSEFFLPFPAPYSPQPISTSLLTDLKPGRAAHHGRRYRLLRHLGRPAHSHRAGNQEGLSQDGHRPPPRFVHDTTFQTVACRQADFVALQTRTRTIPPHMKNSRPSARPTRSSPTPTCGKPTISSERTAQDPRKVSPTPPSSSAPSLAAMPLSTGSARSAL